MTFDGKSAQRLSASAMEITQRANGKIVLTEASTDRKTLTTTTHAARRTLPNIFVFERH